MPARKNLLNELLLEAQILNKDQLGIINEKKNKSDKPFLELICETTSMDKNDLSSQLKDLLELQYGVAFIELANAEIDQELISVFSLDLIKNHKFLPLGQSGNLFTLAMTDPDNLVADQDINFRLQNNNFKDYKVKKVVIFEDDFDSYFKSNFEKKEAANQEIEQDTDELISSIGIEVEHADADISDDISDLMNSAQEAPIIQLANSILGVAIKRGVSDIHIEPREKELQVRYRLDGVLSIYKILPKKIQNSITSRYKIMSDLDISERRLPQDGRIRVKMSNKVVDFRVSTLPSKFGEKIVMRILDKSNISLGLDQLITNTEILEVVREMINRPYGIIFVTGPTGSGKTTTLYSALSERNTPQVNISTAEDPIEYDLDGITQSEVNKVIGMDFAKILKAFLRQDPDIMLVGETRDKETAKIAIEAALTGHLVFTTLHTNDAPSSIMRLEEMDIEPFLISSSIIGIIAQRLLRRICSNCKEQYEPDMEMLKFLGVENFPNKTYYRSKGCEKCNNTGYKGRVGVYEVMKVTDELRDCISKGVNTAILKYQAQQSGMKTLLEYSLDIAREGHTTLEEVIRVTFTSEGQSSMCPNCSKPVGEEFYKCPFCQHDLKKTCPKCKTILQEGWSNCAKCGFNLSETISESICPTCNGDIALEMNECPWCFNKLAELNLNK